MYFFLIKKPEQLMKINCYFHCLLKPPCKGTLFVQYAIISSKPPCKFYFTFMNHLLYLFTLTIQHVYVHYTVSIVESTVRPNICNYHDSSDDAEEQFGSLMTFLLPFAFGKELGSSACQHFIILACFLMVFQVVRRAAERCFPFCH